MFRVVGVAALLLALAGCTPVATVHSLPDSPTCTKWTSESPQIVWDQGPSKPTPEAAADETVQVFGHGRPVEAWQRRGETDGQLTLAAAPYLVTVTRSNDGGWLSGSLRECFAEVR